MLFPVLASRYGAILGLVFFAISIWVVVGRYTFRVNHGDGGNDQLHRRIRAHANFAEYVPLILLLAAALEASGGGGHHTLHALLLPLAVARMMHPFGMIAPENTVQQYIFRGGAMTVTWLVLLAVSVLLLWRMI